MNSSPTLILASSSPYKQALLRRLGLKFAIQPAHVDEARREGEEPLAMARRLAIEKARLISQTNADAFVLGADQVIALGDRVFGKPGSPEAAVDQLMAMQGRTHELIAAVCLVRPDGEFDVATVTYEMAMRPLRRQEAQEYVAHDNPVDCAGSYKIEARGIALFEAARGDDPTAIEGLPLTRVYALLDDAGFFYE